MTAAVRTPSSEPSTRPLLAVGVVFGLVVFIYLGAGIGVHLRQVRLEKRVLNLSPGVSRETVVRLLGQPSYTAPNGAEWLYYPSGSFFELPIPLTYESLYVRFSPAGQVTSAGVVRD